jgi:TolB-like protein/DNA-binding winged helix-turn-helix (wHTH) protein
MDVPASPELLAFGPFRFDHHRRALFRCTEDGQSDLVSIGGRALEVLAALIERPGSVVSKEEITAAVWPNTIVEEANLTVQISALRRALDQGRNGEGSIQTVPGRGYRFVLPVTRAEQALAVPLPPPPVGAATATISRRPWRARWVLVALGAIAAALLIGALAWVHGRLWQQSSLPPLSLVVLPFDNLSSDSGDDYLAAGVTDGLTAALSHIPGAVIIARATASTYRGKAEDIRQIGQDLNVRYVVRGSVQRFGQVLRVNAELGSTETGAQLWSDSFDQRIADLATGQEQIIIRMRAALNVSLADIEAARSLRERPANPDAFDLILRARAMPISKENTGRALALYEQALERDPDAVFALVGAANALMNAHAFDVMPYDVAMERGVPYIERAQQLAPNSESVLTELADVLDWQQDGPNRRRARSQLEAVARKLIDEYPNNPAGYHELGVVRRNTGRFDEASGLFEKAIRLNPRGLDAAGSWTLSVVICSVMAGRDREALIWADRARAAESTLGSHQQLALLTARAAAYARTGDLDAAKRTAKELNGRFPLFTWRWLAPPDPDFEKSVADSRGFRDALRTAGIRDHLDPETDFGVPPDDVPLRFDAFWPEKTPVAAPGVTTIRTEQLAAMLDDDKPLLIDTMSRTWYRSIPGAVGLDFSGDVRGSFTDETQMRVNRKLRELTGGDMAKPIVAMSFNVARPDGYNLALRIRHAGYTNVYWYRGGREAWEVAGKPEEVARPTDW